MYLLSKIVFFLLSPACWILVCLISMLLIRSASHKRKLRTIILLLLIIFTNPFLYRHAVQSWQPKPVDLAPGKVFEAGIVLGGFSGYDIHDRGYFSIAADRFIQVANLYHQGIIRKILMTGGAGSLLQNEPAESVFVRDQLIKNGIPATDIIVESKSRNTFENAVFTKRILDSLQLKGPFVLVTSAIHMPRSEKLFRMAGIEIQPYPCNYNVYDARFSLDDSIFPDLKNLENWRALLKEMLGTFINRVIGRG